MFAHIRCSGPPSAHAETGRRSPDGPFVRDARDVFRASLNAAFLALNVTRPAFPSPKGGPFCARRPPKVERDLARPDFRTHRGCAAPARGIAGTGRPGRGSISPRYRGAAGRPAAGCWILRGQDCSTRQAAIGFRVPEFTCNLRAVCYRALQERRRVRELVTMCGEA